VYVDTLSDESLPHIVRYLAHAGIRGIRGYPNAVSLIAGFIKDTGAPVSPVDSIVTGGAELLIHQRSIISEVFGIQPHSKYSLYEAFEIACECENHEGMHISAEDLVIEVVDEEGIPVPPGVEGRIVVTNLHNFGMLFVRYDLGDNGSMLAGICSCGRTLPRLATLIGRNNMFLVTPGGKRIFYETLFLERLAGLGMRQYQIVQETRETVVMRLIPVTSVITSPDVKSILEREVIDMFRSKFGPELLLRIEFVDRIEPTEAGKHVFMLSKLPHD